MTRNLLCYRDPNFDINSFDYNFESTAQSIISNDYEFDPVSVIPNENSVAYNSCASGSNPHNVTPNENPTISIQRIAINNVADPRNILQRSVKTVFGFGGTSDVSPESNFLMNIEYDVTPQFNTAPNGVQYNTKQKSELKKLMGEDGHFNRQLKIIMKKKEN